MYVGEGKDEIGRSILGKVRDVKNLKKTGEY